MKIVAFAGTTRFDLQLTINVTLFIFQLCGYELEIDFPVQAAEVLSILKQVKDIDVSTERLLKSVLELSQNRWGRTETGTVFETNLF